jgi:predicted kinase
LSKLIMPVGIPGSGKSRLGRDLSRFGVFPKTAIVKPDNIRKLLTDDPVSNLADNLVYQIAQDIATYRIKAGLSVYFDATNIYLDRVSSVLSAAREVGVTPVWIFCETPVDIAYSRNNRRSHPIPVERMDAASERFFNLDRSRYCGEILTDRQVRDMLVDIREGVSL